MPQRTRTTKSKPDVSYDVLKDGRIATVYTTVDLNDIERNGKSRAYPYLTYRRGAKRGRVITPAFIRTDVMPSTSSRAQPTTYGKRKYFVTMNPPDKGIVKHILRDESLRTDVTLTSSSKPVRSNLRIERADI